MAPSISGRLLRFLVVLLVLAVSGSIALDSVAAAQKDKAAQTHKIHKGAKRHNRKHHKWKRRKQSVHKTSRPAPPPLPAGCSDLRWPAPGLSSPITINVGLGGSGYYRLDNQRDYNVVLPSSRRVGQVQIDGGRNITLIGGSLGNYSGGGVALLFFTDNGTDGPAVLGRTIHVAHLNEDLSTGDMGRDAIGLMTPSAVVQLEDIHASGIHGVYTGNHADIVQNYGPVKEIRVDRLTGTTNYQGFFIAPSPIGAAIGKVTLNRVNLEADANPASAYTQVLFLSNSSGQTNPVTLNQVYVNNTRSGQSAQQAVYPDTTAGLPSLFNGLQISFPGYSLLQGLVTGGVPPTGNFACV